MSELRTVHFKIGTRGTLHLTHAEPTCPAGLSVTGVPAELPPARVFERLARVSFVPWPCRIAWEVIRDVPPGRFFGPAECADLAARGLLEPTARAAA